MKTTIQRLDEVLSDSDPKEATRSLAALIRHFATNLPTAPVLGLEDDQLAAACLEFATAYALKIREN